MGGFPGMTFTLTDVLLALILACLVVALLAGWNCV